MLPTNIGSGTFRATFLEGIRDSEDADALPEGMPTEGLTALFTPNLKPAIITDPTSTPAAVILVRPVSATTNELGQLINPDDPVHPFIRLIASVNPLVPEPDWTWTLTITAPGWPAVSRIFAMGVDDDINLGTMVDVPNNPGTELPQWVSAVNAVNAARDAAIEAKVGAEEAAAGVPSLTELTATIAEAVAESGAEQFAPRSSTVPKEIVLPSGAILSALPGALDNKERQNAGGHNNIASRGDFEYVVWMDDQRRPIIGKRTLSSGKFETFDLSTVTGNPLGSPTEDDGHNHYVVGIDLDGYLHVSGNMHGDWLRYVRSNTPHDIGAWTKRLMLDDTPIEKFVSYPQFVNMPNGEFLFFFRSGSSAGGTTYINVYNRTAKTWSRRNAVLDGTVGATTAGAYHTIITPEADGVIHMFFVWRPDGSSTNAPSIGYIKSLDGGLTFKLVDGTTVTLPVTQASTPVVATHTGPQNMSGMAVDAAGRPHACWWGRTGTVSELRHLYWDGAAWQYRVLISLGLHITNVQVMAAPSVFSHAGRVYVVYSTADKQNNRQMRVRDITPGAALNDFVLIGASLGGYELTYDHAALRARGELVSLVSPMRPSLDSISPVAPEYAKAWGAVMTFPLSEIEAAQRINPVTASRERMWIGAAALSAWEGSPVAKPLAGVPSWQLPDAVTGSVATLTRVPPEWQAVTVDLWWANDAAVAGNVRFEAQVAYSNTAKALTVTSDYNLTGAATAVASTTQNAPTVTRLLTAYPLVYTGEERFNRIGIRRYGADALDTLPNGALLLGIMLSPALL